MKKNPTIATVKAVLTDGVHSEFWEILCRQIDGNIELLQKEQDEMGDLPAAEYKIQCEILRAKKVFLRELKDMPTVIMDSFTTPDEQLPELDPYKTMKDLQTE